VKAIGSSWKEPEAAIDVIGAAVELLPLSREGSGAREIFTSKFSWTDEEDGSP